MIDDLDLQDHLHKLGWFAHRPPAPYPRTGHVGEHVYAEEWQAYMLAPPKDWPENVPNENLYRLLARHRRRGWIRKYDAEICARVVCWLGSNIGRCFAEGADRLQRDTGCSGETAFVMKWAQENTRHHFMNHGVRTVEHLLAREKDFAPTGTGRLWRWPRLSVDTLEVVDCLVYWLGSHEGVAFRRKCETKIEEINRFVRLTKQAEHKADLVKLGLLSAETVTRIY